jgi:hypothetical protein
MLQVSRISPRKLPVKTTQIPDKKRRWLQSEWTMTAYRLLVLGSAPSTVVGTLSAGQSVDWDLTPFYSWSVEGLMIIHWSVVVSRQAGRLAIGGLGRITQPRQGSDVDKTGMLAQKHPELAACLCMTLFTQQIYATPCLHDSTGRVYYITFKKSPSHRPVLPPKTLQVWRWPPCMDDFCMHWGWNCQTRFLRFFVKICKEMSSVKLISEPVLHM